MSDTDVSPSPSRRFRPAAVFGVLAVTLWCAVAGYGTLVSMIMGVDCGEAGGYPCEGWAERIAIAGTVAHAGLWAALVVGLTVVSRRRGLRVLDWAVAFALPLALMLATWMTVSGFVSAQRG